MEAQEAAKRMLEKMGTQDEESRYMMSRRVEWYLAGVPQTAPLNRELTDEEQQRLSEWAKALEEAFDRHLAELDDLISRELKRQKDSQQDG